MGKIWIAECMRVGVSADVLGWQNDMTGTLYFFYKECFSDDKLGPLVLVYFELSSLKESRFYINNSII